MSNVIDIGAIEPWDLAVKIGRETYATREPTWADVLALSEIKARLAASYQQMATDGAIAKTLRADLASAVCRFFPEALAETIESLDWGDLNTIFRAVEAYWTAWMEKKQEAATAVAEAFVLGGPTPADAAATKAPATTTRPNCGPACSPSVKSPASDSASCSDGRSATG